MIEDLREVNLGEWEGGEYRVRMAKRDPIAMRALMEQRWDVIPGAEPMERWRSASAAAGHDARRDRPGRHRRRRAARRRDRRAVPSGRRTADRSPSSTPTTARSPASSQFATGHRLLRNFNDTAHLA